MRQRAAEHTRKARMIVAILLVSLSFLSIVAAADYFEPARIVITTDGESAAIERSGGDVGYPGPSLVTIEHDALGIVVVSRTRIFTDTPKQVYLPLVLR